MPTITSAKALADYRIELTFDDGAHGVVDLSGFVGKGVFAVWNDPEAFNDVRIGPSGALVWDDDIDLCPDALYLEVTGKQPDELFPAIKREDANA